VRATPTSAVLALAALAALGAPGSARGEDDEVEIQGGALLHARFTSREREPGLDLLFSRAARTFGLADYLRPSSDARYLSGFAALGLEGRRGSWRWQLAADTGEVRRLRGPRSIPVCASFASDTGFAQPGGGQCTQRLWSLPENVLDGSEAALSGRSAGEELRRTWLLREAWIGGRAGERDFAFVRAGRHRFTVGDGFIYDDYGLGLEARFDLGALGPSWDLGAALFWPTRDWPSGAVARSPLLLLRADYLLSLFDHVGAFAAAMHDAAGDVPELFRGAEIEASAVRLQRLLPAVGTPQQPSAYQAEAWRLADVLTRPMEGSADLLWLGLAGNFAPARGQRVTFTAALSTGQIHFRALPPRPGATPVDVSSVVLGGLASASWDLRVHRDLLLGAQGLWISGDVPPPERRRLGLPVRYHGFLGVAPWITATNLFFRGGLSETFAARQASAPGVNGRGVFGPIVRAAWEPSASLRADAKAAWLAAPEVGPYGGRVYGPEVDLNLRFAPAPWLTLSAEADALWPGDFYGGGPPVRKIVLGVDLLYP
jgi:hypothetical protein